LILERWSVVKDKLCTALELEGEHRAAHLDEIAQHDPDGRSLSSFRADDEYRKEVAIKLVRAGQASGLILNVRTP